MRTRFLALFLLAAGAPWLAGCDDAATRGTRSRMVGTWMLETDANRGTMQRFVTLAEDGTLRDTTRTVAGSAASEREERAGEWFYDGRNFKRKYTSIGGRPLTNAHVVYETYEVKSVSATELVGASSVGGGQVRYRRVGP